MKYIKLIKALGGGEVVVNSIAITAIEQHTDNVTVYLFGEQCFLVKNKMEDILKMIQEADSIKFTTGPR
jgi:uncharacterized protein YlzI (FlbEa/FlbD family)